MKVSIKQLRAYLQEQFKTVLKNEDSDRLRRAADKYGETEFEEDADRVRRHKDGYGDDLEEKKDDCKDSEVKTENLSLKGIFLEKAPPGGEKQVLALKKKVGKQPGMKKDSPYKIAWSLYKTKKEKK